MIIFKEIHSCLINLVMSIYHNFPIIANNNSDYIGLQNNEIGNKRNKTLFNLKGVIL